jgi:hypothetical protein
LSLDRLEGLFEERCWKQDDEEKENPRPAREKRQEGDERKKKRKLRRKHRETAELLTEEESVRGDHGYRYIHIWGTINYRSLTRAGAL